MVKKLFKHEFLAWLRVLPVIYGITLAVSAMHRIIQLFETNSVYYNFIFISASVMYGIVLLVSLAAPVVFGIQRFYKNMFTGEGYLTHTLPVTPGNHLLVKSVTAVCFSAASILVCGLSAVIITAGEVLFEICKAGAYLVRHIPEQYAADLVFYIAEGLLLLLVAGFATHFLYYFCICAGQLFRKNRVLAAVGVYFVLYMITQILGTVLGVVLMILSETGAFDMVIDWVGRYPLETIHIGLCGSVAVYSVLTLLYYFVCHYILKKKLNLE